MDKKRKRPSSICFVAGGSGGHIIPALTIAQNIKKKNSRQRIILFTTNKKLDKKIVDKKQIFSRIIFLSCNNIQQKKMFQYPICFIEFIISFLISFYTMVFDRPKKIISLGGYISIPVCLAASVLKIPIELFELNSSPGKAIKFLSPFAKTIYASFRKATEQLPLKKCKITDYPIRFSKSTKKPSLQKKTKYTILVLGGSQGSISINNLFKQWILRHKDLHKNIYVIHQTGNNDKTDWKKFYHMLQIPAISFDFKGNIKKYYQNADIIICRSGAGTLFETIFFEKKCITIPLETSTTKHQVDNALEISTLYPNLVTVIRKQEIDKDINTFFHQINSLISKKHPN